MRLALEDLRVEPDASEASDSSSLAESAGSQDRQADERSGEDPGSALPLEQRQGAAPENLGSEPRKWPLAVGLLFILVSSATFWGLVFTLLRLD